MWSLVIFLTVMCTLSDTLKIREDLGFSLPNSSLCVNQLLLLYTCIIGHSPAACQHLLDLSQHWLQWSQLRAKVPKCLTLAIQVSTGRVIYRSKVLPPPPPPVEDHPFKFLGMPVKVPRIASEARASLKDTLERMFNAVDNAPVTHHQKLRLFRQGICPRLTWPFMMEDIPISWFVKVLQPLATRFLKKWAGLPRSANVAILFLPTKKGGLGLY